MNIAVIFAGGSGQRMGVVDLPKQFLRVHGKPIIIYTLELFDNHPNIDAIVISCKSDYIDYLKNLIEEYSIKKVTSIVSGGKTGQLSIYQGLLAAKEISLKETDIVLIHDGVRPLINSEVISENIKMVKKHGSAITTSVVKETILLTGDNNHIQFVPSRKDSRIAKAPQSFVLRDILECHKKALKDGKEDFIDSCTMMSFYNYPLFLVDGPYENIKITTPDDYFTMRALLDAKENEQLYSR